MTLPRWQRLEMLIGAEGLARLRAARVAIIGLGAVGSYAAEALARAGLGFLRLVDFDIIRPTNLNRQLFALDSTCGLAKVDVAQCRLRDINPDCEVQACRLFAHRDTLPQILAPPLDAVIDAIDSYTPKAEVIAASVAQGLFVVSSMGAANRTDPAAVRAGDLFHTRNCPLARLLRKKLRRRGIGSGVRCIYSLELPRPTAQPCPTAEEMEYKRGRQRQPLGSLPTLPGIFGLWAAQEVIAWLLGWRAAER
ncbi:MAG: tRNA threonylcarbamoyladenosine dehydratase [Planctomycetota bacterium]|nr:tRNA threonylcarbamoyladenosine dehydratase [Planctomycetota bacterium]